MPNPAQHRWQRKLSHALRLDRLSPPIRRVVVGIAGITILLIGIALLVLPGPAFLIIPLGIAVLATEFAWAGSILTKAGNWLKRFRKWIPRKWIPFRKRADTGGRRLPDREVMP